MPIEPSDGTAGISTQKNNHNHVSLGLCDGMQLPYAHRQHPRRLSTAFGSSSKVKCEVDILAPCGGWCSDSPRLITTVSIFAS
mmetsp:Transcript_2366/g.7613  ORF Transcript_2366/g.7613 Transcript_2366/m.7613 type:complete len:83 (+) Transcript_2366:3467-3715(+)